MKTIKQAMTVVTMCVLMGASAWADTTNTGNLFVPGFVEAYGFGEQAGMNTVGATNSIFVGYDAGANATGAFNSAVFGAFSTIPSGARYQFVYGAHLTNGAPDFSHLFGHLGTNYVAFTKDGASFYVPITLVAGNLTLTNGGTLNLTGANVTGLNASQISVGQLPASVMPAGGIWNAGNMTISNVVIQGNNLTVGNNATISGSSLFKSMVNIYTAQAHTNFSYVPDLSLHSYYMDYTYRALNFQVLHGTGGNIGHAIVSDGYISWAPNGDYQITDSWYQKAAGILLAGDGGFYFVNSTNTTGMEHPPATPLQFNARLSDSGNLTVRGYVDANALGLVAVASNGGVAVGPFSLATDCSLAAGVGALAYGWCGTAIGLQSRGSGGGFAGGAFAKANGYGSIAIGGGIEWWGDVPAAVADGYQDAIQLGRNRVSINTNIPLAANHYLRVWGGVPDGGLELNGENGTLSVSNLTVRGVVTLPRQGDIEMGSFTNGPSQ